MTLHRLHAARQAPAILQCPLCREAPDTAEHNLSCRVVRTAFDLTAGALPAGARLLFWSQLFFQSPIDPDLLRFTIALFTAAWG